MKANDPLHPFRRSRTIRHAYLDRTRRILSAIDGATAGTTAVAAILLALPDILDDDDDDDDKRTAAAAAAADADAVSTTSNYYVIRPATKRECEALFDPTRCNCRMIRDDVIGNGGGGGNGSTRILIMYRVPSSDVSHYDADATSALIAQYDNNRFGGSVVLGVCLDSNTETASSSSPIAAPSTLGDVMGVSNNGLISDAILEPGCSVHTNVEISSTHVMSHASIVGCGTVSCPAYDVLSSAEMCNFDMRDGSMDVMIGPESGGGRVCNVKVEYTMIDVCHELNMDTRGKGTMPSLLLDATNATAPVEEDGTTTTNMNVLCPHSSLRHAARTKHVHLLPHSTIDSATSVSSSILLPYSSILDGSTVSCALLQWHSKIVSQSDARRVLLMERAEVGPHSFTANAMYGPDSHVSGGEVHCTLFGPNANSHHQSLLIGILWPLGRGNVGYGSNVGSNHTGRIPDQETSVGEGTFWGLGCVIKFPVDLTSSPYSIVAAGVQLPPQRIAFPFSLITDGPGGMNQLTPGWLLHYSPYTIARSEVKFANRRTAKRHDFYTGWKILRAGIMDMITNARDALERAGRMRDGGGGGGGVNEKIAPYRTDRAVLGLGANQLTEQGRLIGVRAYNSALQRYALRGLLDRLVKLVIDAKGSLMSIEALRCVGLGGAIVSAMNEVVEPSPARPTVNWPILPWNEVSHSNADVSWEHQRLILLRELPSILLGVGGDDKNANCGDDAFLTVLLRRCVELEDDHARRVYDSKSRDDVRGAATVPGYGDVHVNAERDPVVLMTRKEAEDVRRDVRMVEDALVGMARSRL